MNIVLIGPQGSGKGTQGELLSEELGAPHISVGDLLRHAAQQDTETGRKLKAVMDRGDLVSNEFMRHVFEERLSEDDCSEGWILDGSPRDLEQARLLDEIADVDAAIEISITDDEAVERISSRWVCPEGHAQYNAVTNPPENDGECDVCGRRLVQRDDDTPDAVRRRLELYHEETVPVLDYYEEQGKLIRVDGMQPIGDVFDELRRKLYANHPEMQTVA